MSELALCIATMTPQPSIPDPVITLTRTSATGLSPQWTYFRRNTPDNNLGVVASYQALYEMTTEPLIAYIHDDVIIHETGWDARVIAEFDDPQVGVVGFGGGLQHGSPDIYKRPYRLQQLARAKYLSNTDDAEAHGERFTSACDVAVLDGFALVVRRSLLDGSGGWPRVAGGFHCYDYAICALAHRLGYRVRVVGVRCHHLGGRTSTTKEYQSWAERRGMTDIETHELSHRWVYDEFKDVLPWRCE